MHRIISRRTRRNRGNESREQERISLYEEVTARIVNELEAGRLPWVQPWSRADGTGPGLPRNALTARPYSGINILILWGAVIEHGFPSQSWLTFRQALEAGGRVRKGERGVTVVYADRFTPEAEKERATRECDDAKAIPFLKRFTVFNVAQCEGLREGLALDPGPLPEREVVPVAEEVIIASGVEFRIGGDRAFYVPALDHVQVPSTREESEELCDLGFFRPRGAQATPSFHRPANDTGGHLQSKAGPAWTGIILLDGRDEEQSNPRNWQHERMHF